MALSNKFGWLPLATSNKSEAAVGYCTIYGDMCGGFAPLLDCSKMRVYELARYRNSLSEAIPEQVIARPPSAELRPGQSDQDSLPPYEILDQVLQRYVEQDWSVTQIIEDGFDADMVRRVARLVLLSEYKRRQAPPGVRITHRAFGRDRRYPITSGWRRIGPNSSGFSWVTWSRINSVVRQSNGHSQPVQLRFLFPALHVVVVGVVELQNGH